MDGGSETSSSYQHVASFKGATSSEDELDNDIDSEDIDQQESNLGIQLILLIIIDYYSLIRLQY